MPRKAKSKKEEEIKVRVSIEMKNKVLALAAERDEHESVIIREAIREYLDAREHGTGLSPQEIIARKKGA